MKILQVLDSYYPKIDGPHSVLTFYTEILNTLPDTQAEAIVPATKNYEDVQKFVVRRVKSIPAVEGYEMALAGLDRKLKKFLKENPVDIIHLHSPFTLGRFFVNWGKKHGVPTVYTFHTAFKEDFERVLKRQWQQKWIMNYIMKTINGADQVLSVSNGAADILRSYGYSKPIGVIRNGTDFVYPENAEKLKAEINQKYGLSDDDIVFLSVGRIVQNKRLDVLVDACKILKEKGMKFKFFVVGGGVYLDELKQKAEKLGLDDCVIFVGRLPERSDIIPYFVRANLLLFPSTFDTASLAPIEAAAMKLPSMLTRGAPTAEIIEDNKNGYLAGDTAEEWAERLFDVCADRASLEQMREVCHREVFNPWTAVVDEVYAKYKEVIENKKAELLAKSDKA